MINKFIKFKTTLLKFQIIKSSITVTWGSHKILISSVQGTWSMLQESKMTKSLIQTQLLRRKWMRSTINMQIKCIQCNEPSQCSLIKAQKWMKKFSLTKTIIILEKKLICNQLSFQIPVKNFLKAGQLNFQN